MFLFLSTFLYCEPGLCFCVNGDVFSCQQWNVCRKVKNSLGLDTNAVWVDAGQMMTARTRRATHRHKQAHKTHNKVCRLCFL